MRDVLDQLESYQTYLDSRYPAVTAEDVLEPHTAADRVPLPIEERVKARRSRPGVPAWAAAGVAAVLVLVAVGVPILLFGGGDSVVTVAASTTVPPTVTTLPGTTVAPTATTVPSTTAPPALLAPADSWKQVGAEVMEPVLGLLAMAQFGPGLVAVGFDPGEDLRQDGVIFMSDDGVTWTRLAEDDPALTTGTVLIRGIAEGGPGLIAIGVSCEDDSFPCEAGPFPTVWTSVDGTSWTRSVIDSELGDMMDVVVSDGGLVAAGRVTEFDEEGVSWTRPTVWKSPDGIAWSRSWQGDAARNDEYPPSRGVIGGLATGSDGLMIAFGKAEDGTGSAVVAVWSSADGEMWERIEADSGAFTTETGVIPLDASWGPGGFVMVGSEVDGESFDVVMWHSADGRGWSRIDTSDQDFGTTGSISSIIGTDSGFTATGPYGFVLDEGPVSVWTSIDGQIWNEAGVVADGYSQAIITTETGVLIAGAIREGEDYVGAIWLGPALDPLSP